MQAGLLSLYWEACLWEACVFCPFQLNLNQPPDGNLVLKYGCGPTALGTMKHCTHAQCPNSLVCNCRSLQPTGQTTLTSCTQRYYSSRPCRASALLWMWPPAAGRWRQPWRIDSTKCGPATGKRQGAPLGGAGRAGAASATRWLPRQACAHILVLPCTPAAACKRSGAVNMHAPRPAPPRCRSTQAQLNRAVQRPNLRYFLAAAEALEGVAGGTVDLLTAAQGLHWLDGPAFYDEARRVLQPGGTLAIWGERAQG